MKKNIGNTKKKIVAASTPTSAIPEVLDEKYINQLETFGAARLDRASICALLDCTVAEFEQRMAEDPQFKTAIVRGKARVQQSCAAIVIQTIQGKDVDSKKLEAAMFYLEKHAPNWMRDK